jgi:hypothetical protein
MRHLQMQLIWPGGSVLIGPRAGLPGSNGLYTYTWVLNNAAGRFFGPGTLLPTPGSPMGELRMIVSLRKTAGFGMVPAGSRGPEAL